MDSQIDLLLRSIEGITYETKLHLDEFSSEQLEEFVNEREVMFDQLKKLKIPDEFKTEIAERAHSLLEADKVILLRLTVLKEEAAKEIQKLEAAKRQKSAYDQYDVVDSFFIDKKK